MDANVSTMTMPKTMPVQNLCRYISFKSIQFENFSKQTQVSENRDAILKWISPQDYVIITLSLLLPPIRSIK